VSGAGALAALGPSRRARTRCRALPRGSAPRPRIAATAGPIQSCRRVAEAIVKLTDVSPSPAAADIGPIATTRAEFARGRRSALRRISPRQKPVIACAKGDRRVTHTFMTRLFAESAPSYTCESVGADFALGCGRSVLPTSSHWPYEGRPLPPRAGAGTGSSTFRPYHPLCAARRSLRCRKRARDRAGILVCINWRVGASSADHGALLRN